MNPQRDPNQNPNQQGSHRHHTHSNYHQSYQSHHQGGQRFRPPANSNAGFAPSSTTASSGYGTGNISANASTFVPSTLYNTSATFTPGVGIVGSELPPLDKQIQLLVRNIMNTQDSPNKRIQAIAQLKSFITTPQNDITISKSLERLLSSLEPLLLDRTPNLKSHVSSLLGSLGTSLKGQDSNKFAKWIMQTIDTVAYKETKSCLLAVLKEFMENGEKKTIQAYVPTFVGKLKNILEESQDYQVLTITMQLINYTVTNYIPLIKQHFQDIVDLLVGWRLYPNVPDNIIQLITDVFLALQPLWIEHIAFTTDLLDKFITDMNGIVTTSPSIYHISINDPTDTRVQLMNRLISFLHCFTIIVQVMAESFAKEGNALTLKILDCFNNIYDKFQEKSCVTQVNLCLAMISQVLGTNFVQYIPKVLQLLSHSLSPLPHIETIKVLLSSNVKILQRHGNLLTVEILNLFIKDINVQSLRLYPSSTVMNLIMEFYKIFLNATMTDPTKVKICIDSIVDEIQLLVQALENSTPAQIQTNDSGNQDSALANYPYLSYPSEMITLITIDLMMLSFIQGLPTSIVDSLISSLLRKCNPFKNSICNSFPKLQVAVINTLRSLNQQIQQKSLIEDVASLLSDCVMCQTSPSALSKLLLLDWLKDILDNTTTSSETIVSATLQELIYSLGTLAVDNDDNIRIEIGHIFTQLLSIPLTKLNCHQLYYICNIAVVRLGDFNSAIRQVYFDLLSVLGTSIIKADSNIARNISYFKVLDNKELFQLMQQQITYQFRPLHFLRMMNFIGQRTIETLPAWINHLFNLGTTLSHHHKVSLGTGNVVQSLDTSDILGNLWAPWECARFCIVMRLRTPFGSPVQTFEAIERMINNIMNLSPIIPVGTQTNQLALVRDISSRYLLQFADHLEKQTYNSYEWALSAKSVTGTHSVNQSTVQQSMQSIKNSALFFIANRKVCEDWFARMRHSLMTAAVNWDVAHDTVFHSMQRILDLQGVLIGDSIKDPKKFSIDLDIAIINYVVALIELRESDAVQGLSVWVEQQLGPFLSSKEFASFEAFKWVQGAMLQSQGSYENAASKYKECLRSSTRQTDVELLINEITQCYVKLYDWKSLSDWMSELIDVRSHYQYPAMITSSMEAYDNRYMQALMKFQFDDMLAVNDFLDGKNIMEQPQTSNLVAYNDQLLLVSMSLFSLSKGKVAEENTRKCLELLNLSTSLTRDHIKVISTTNNNSIMQQKQLFNHIIHLSCLNQLQTALENTNECKKRFSNSVDVLMDEETDRTNYLTDDIGIWNKLLMVRKFIAEKIFQSKFPQNDYDEQLCHYMIKLSRKQHNHSLAHRLINIRGKSVESTFEEAKFSYHKNNKIEAVTALSRLCKLMQDPTRLTNKRLLAEVYFKLGTWLNRDSSLFTPPFIKSLHLFSNEDNIDDICGKCFNESSSVDSLFFKGWFEYGNWCYHQGNKTLSVDESVNAASRLTLTAEESTELNSIILKHQYLLVQSLNVANDEEREEKKELLVQEIGNAMIHSCSISDDDAYDTTEYHNQRDKASSVLRNLCPWGSKQLIEELTLLWFAVRRRSLSYYEVSVNSYFKFIKSRYQKTQQMASTDLTSDASVIAAISRIFLILLKYGSEMQDTFAQGINESPTHPWNYIIPQLFSRLGHPDHYIGQQIIDLLCKIGSEFPHLIVYPAIVASSTGSQETSNLTNVLTQQQKQIANNIVHSMMTHSPELVSEVQTMITELTQITTLWEEQWMTVLQQAQNEVVGKIRTFKNEIMRRIENSSLPSNEKSRVLRDKYAVIMKPTVTLLEKIYADTCAKAPSTNHEKWFTSSYSESLKTAISVLKSPINFQTNPEANTIPLKELCKEFNKYLKPSTLKLHDIAPNLAKQKFDFVGVPGLQSATSNRIMQLSPNRSLKQSISQSANDDDGLITIDSFETLVNILPTKTRPKKLSITASNGHKYPYLLKGTEDLHLDERIMQILTIINQFLAHEKESYLRGLRARKYAVIPLSEKSGLIQWVENAVPLFQYYKQWQRKDAISKMNQQSLQQSKDFNVIVGQANKEIVRPTDLFYAKIIPALKEKGITNVMSRKDWPIQVLKDVFFELQRETPKNLLSKEIWSKSLDNLDWWNKTQSFNRSAAVMSVVGYAIGLGDRHLDNILLDSNVAEVVHIDYNVCFEKGLKLKIPERVPFRMTQNIVSALGLTGVEGTFRIAAQHVMNILRRNREVLLTLLEAFIYDPLVDWTADKAEDDSRKMMELNVSLTLFSSRIDEMKQPIHRLFIDNLSPQLPTLENSAMILCSAIQRHSIINQQLAEVHNQLEENQQTINALELEEKKNQNVLLQATERNNECYDERKRSLALLHQSAKELLVIQQENESLINILKDASLESLANDLMQSDSGTSASGLGAQVLANALNIFGLTNDSSITSKCNNAQSSMNSAINQVRRSLGMCLNDLRSYGNTLLFLPVDYAFSTQISKCHSKVTRIFELISTNSLLTMESIEAAKSIWNEDTSNLITLAPRSTATVQVEIASKSSELEELKNFSTSQDKEFEKAIMDSHQAFIEWIRQRLSDFFFNSTLE